MKVIFVLPNLRAGGAERVVTILSEKFVSYGWDVSIVLMLDSVIEYEVDKRVEVVSLDTRKFAGKARIKKMREYFKKEKKINERIILIPFLDTCLKNSIGAAWGLHIPIIACERNNPYKKGMSLKQKVLSNIPYILADGCVFQTEGARDYYCSAVQKKSQIIENPIQIKEDFRWQGKDTKRIVAVGRLEPQKNHKLLIEAFEQFYKKFSDFKLEIYGVGSLKKDLECMIEKKELAECVFLCGHTDKVFEILSEASLFVLSSDYEGLSNALIEAMIIGIPVVSTDHPTGGARQLIDNKVNGMLVPVKDIDALAKAMEEVLSNKKLAESLSKNACLLKERLDADLIADKWIEFICSLLRK